ncbi:MAG: alpha amylase N-terminal ig-like domain-containing protein [Planctomycetota bacterium]
MHPTSLLLSLLAGGSAQEPRSADSAVADQPSSDRLASGWPVAPALAVEPGEAGPLPASVTAEPAPTGGWLVTFSLASSVRASEVSIAGTFNGWDATEHPLKRDADGRWRTRIRVPDGVHSYKFVLDRAAWVPDPVNDDRESDGFTGENTLLRLGAVARPETLTASVRDGVVVTAALEHDPGRSLYLQPAPDGRALLRYRTLADDVEAVSVVVRGVGEVPMRVAARTGAFLYWEAALDVADEPLTYGFLLRDGALIGTDPREYQLDAAQLPHFRTPDWSKHAIWYQIMVDRFRNGAPENDPPHARAWTSAWYEPSEAELATGERFYEYFVFRRMYGGDLEGVRQKLDHLVALGVNALYFNPIFEAPGHHKYNATDFRHIDTGYGAGEDYHEATAREDLLDPSTWVFTPSDKVFLTLLKECKARGLRVILDGVFNHVGVRHPAFVDVLANGKDSRFADWFDVRSWEPFDYVGWAGFGELPVFAKAPHGFASDAVKEHLFAITRRWMDPDGDGDPSDGIDGWRLDVPMEVAMPFWEEWRDLVKSINPDAYITGEVWDLAESWLDGERFDAVMNYRFADTVVAWIGHRADKISASELDRRLALVRLAYPAESTSALMDLLDSHDTDRFVSMMLNPDRAFDQGNREQEAGSTYDPRKPDPIHYARLRLAVLLQMTYVGAPMVYYGDEVGMWGSDDPNNRKPMLWRDLEPYANAAEDRVDGALLDYYQRVIRLRREHTALRIGAFETLVADDAQDLLVFRRALDGDELIVALTPRTADASFALPPGEWRVIFGPAVHPLDRADGRVGVPGCRAGGDDGDAATSDEGGRVWARVR